MYYSEIEDIDKPLLDWNGFLNEIVAFHTDNKELLNQFDGEDIDIQDTAKKLFMHLCQDYYYATRQRPLSSYDLTYKLAEA